MIEAVVKTNDLVLLQHGLPICIDLVDEDDNPIAAFYVEDDILYLDLFNGGRQGMFVEKDLTMQDLETLMGSVGMRYNEDHG